MKQVKSESTVRPQEWDTTSSETTVYHNYNVAELPAQAGTKGPLLYQYDQQQLTRQEYLEYRLQKSEENIRYLAEKTNITLQS